MTTVFRYTLRHVLFCLFLLYWFFFLFFMYLNSVSSFCSFVKLSDPFRCSWHRLIAGDSFAYWDRSPRISFLMQLYAKRIYFLMPCPSRMEAIMTCYGFLYFIIYELPDREKALYCLAKYIGNVSHGVLHGFEFRMCVLLDWQLPKARYSIMPCYLTYGWWRRRDGFGPYPRALV